MKDVFESAFAKAEDSYSDAKLLLENERYTGAINRCYYAVFYLASIMLLDKDIHVKTHSGVIRKFSELYIQSGELPEKLISLYRKIYEKRQVADYDVEYHAHADEAEKALANAREFLDTIREFFRGNKVDRNP